MRLEVLEVGERLPARVHLYVEILGSHPVVAGGSEFGQRQQQEPDRRILPVGQPRPGGDRIDVTEPLIDRVEHDEHRLDRGVMPPHEQVPRLIPDPLRWDCAVWQRMLAEALAEHPSALARGVGELLPAVILIEELRSRGQVPVKQEQRGEPLLTIEGLERPRFDPTVDEVQADSLRGFAYDSGVERIEEVDADPLDTTALASLRVIALEKRNLDPLDGEPIA